MNRNAKSLVPIAHRRVIGMVLLLLVLPMGAKAEYLLNLTLESGGYTRLYDLVVPGDLGGQPTALVLDLHGYTSTKNYQRDNSGFDEVALREGFIVAYPNGLFRDWEGVIGQGTDDIGFLRDLVAHLVGEYDIDPQRVYASGFSRGGAMVYRLACEAAGLFAAFSVVSDTMQTDNAPMCHPGRPVPILSFHGLDDQISPYGGGIHSFLDITVSSLSAIDSLEFWRDKNGCSGPLEREDFGEEAWCDADRHCQGGVQTVMCTVTGDSESGNTKHIIYYNTAGLDLAERSWDFFQLFTLESSGFAINAGLNDAWVSAEAPLQGFFFTVFQDLGFFFLSWFTFDSEPPAGGNSVFGAIDQRWVTGGGAYSGDTATISVELTSGGVFNASDPMAAQTPGYGTIIIVFTGCNEALLTYDFPSLGLSGQMTLTRVLTDNVPLCTALATP